MRLRYGYLGVGIALGFLLLLLFIITLPDGKLHIRVCDVGQGDSTYLRMPDGKDVLIDGGPDTKQVLLCLGRAMPFYDRHIDLVILTHPHSDHVTGLSEVVKRFSVGRVLKSIIDGDAPSYAQFMTTIRAKKIPVEMVTAGDTISVGSVLFRVLWPTKTFISELQNIGITGATTDTTQPINDRLNETSSVLHISYGAFDALFTGDADTLVEQNYSSMLRPKGDVELLKVPHQGSKTAMSNAFLLLMKPRVAVIPVGKNTYGHPSAETLKQLSDVHARVFRTDESGDIEIVTDGNGYTVSEQKK